MTYVDDLGRELTAVGIAGRLRRRIEAEIQDHLACDPQAQLGDPRTVARRFADELGTARALRAAAATFAALAIAGVLFVVALLTSPYGALGLGPGRAPVLGQLGTTLAVLAPQVALVAGGLAALRALRRRRVAAMPAAEATVLVRRAGVGAAFGAAALVGLALIAIGYHRFTKGGWETFALVAAGAGVLALLATVPALMAARRLGPVTQGPAGDIFSDIGEVVPGPLRGRPWLFALATAAVVAVVITLSGAVASDAIDGAFRGLVDAAACLIGFATLGRYLGLWAPQGSEPDAGPAGVTAGG